MSNSNINRIEPIAPFRSYSKYSCKGKLTECLLGKSTETEEFTKAREERLREMKEKKLQEEEENMKERDRLIREKHGEEMVNREMDKKKELIVDNKQLEECKKKIKVCGLCQKQLDPSDFNFGNTKNENTVVMVGNGKYKEDGRNVYPIPTKKDKFRSLCIQQYGMGRNSLAEKLGITLDELYDEYMNKCNISECDINCLSFDITSNSNLQKILDKRFFYTDIDCGHKFHKKCILGEIEKQKGIYKRDTVTARGEEPVTCPTCSNPIKKLYYFLPTYCDKIDEIGQFIVRKNRPSATAIPTATIPTAIPTAIPTMKSTTPTSGSVMATLGKNDTKQNKTKKKLTFADNNEMRFYEKGSVTDDFFGGGRKRKSVRKTRRKNRKHKKTRKYKKN
jgi:hypothetical protein